MFSVFRCIFLTEDGDIVSWVVYFLFPYIIKHSLQSSHRRCSVRIDALGNFAKLTGKHLCQSLCFNKVAGLRQDILYLLGCTWDKIEREILYLLGCLIPTFRFIFFRLTSIWFKNYANTSKKVFIQKRLLKISQVYSINQNLKNINSAK